MQCRATPKYLITNQAKNLRSFLCAKLENPEIIPYQLIVGEILDVRLLWVPSKPQFAIELRNA